MSKIGDFIRKKMREQNVSLEELSEKCGLSSMSIFRVINKKNYNPTLLTLKKICKVLNINISEIITDDETNEEDIHGFLEYKGIIHKISSYNEFLKFYELVVSTNINNNDNRMKGYCYIMHDNNYPNAYKLGKSKKPKKREGTLLHDAPSITLYKAVKTDNMYKLEKELHNKFKEKRIRGEWFNLTETEVNDIIEKYNFVDYE